MSPRNCARLWTLLTCVVTTVTGCASGPYQFGRGWQSHIAADRNPHNPESTVQVETGRPSKFVDGVGWVLGIPGKVLLWDLRVNNHRVTENTVESVATYLQRNQLQDVQVRINQYAPGGEWHRLVTNREVGSFWRYTLGTLSLVEYTLLPGRLIGGDRYNPYTNSLYVYSDVPPLAMQSAAYSKDIHRRKYPGAYAAVNELPIIGLWHETIATRDALAYVDSTGDPQQMIEALEILHPYYGSRVGGAVNLGPMALIGGTVVGHVSGRWQAHWVVNSSTESAWVEMRDDQTIQLAKQ